MNEGLYYYVMGRMIPVTKVCADMQTANRYMEHNPPASLLHVMDDDACILADKENRGIKICIDGR